MLIVCVILLLFFCFFPPPSLPSPSLPLLSLPLPPSPPSLLPGNVESTEPTKCLMRIAEYVDSIEHSGGELRGWFLDSREEVLDMLAEEKGRVERVKRRRDTAVTERSVCTEVESDLHSVHYAVV